MLVEATAAARAAKQATSSIPIVMGVVAEPVETGLVTNLARPDGNITGFTSLTPELSTKRLGLLKEAFPEMKRVGVLRNPRNPGNVLQLASLKEAAATLSIDVETADAERRDAIGPALDQLWERGASAVIILGDSVYFNEHKLIVLLVTAKRLPAIYPDRVFEGANSPTRGRKLRSTGTKARAHVSDEPNSLVELKKQLEARTRELAEARGHLSEALEQQTATSE